MSTADTRRDRDQHFPRTHSTSPSTGQPRAASTSPKEDKRDRSKSNVSTVLPPSDLFPLDGLLQRLLVQEGDMWVKNELLLQSLRPGSGNETNQVEVEFNDSVSLTTLANSTTGTPTPDLEEEQNTNGLYFITYGRLTNSIHKYFRRLERKHACLYLTARKAKHDRLRHVERPDRSGPPDVPPDVTQSAVSALIDGGRQQTNLRDEDLLVYRCSLMCAQFPMLSAPEPPDGQSPTPPPVALPLKFATSKIGSIDSEDLSRTAPAEFLHTFMSNGANSQNTSHQNGPIAPQSNGQPPHASTQDNETSTLPPTSSAQVVTGSNGLPTEQSHGAALVTQVSVTSKSSTGAASTERSRRPSSESPEVNRKVHNLEEVDGRPNPSAPIPIRGAKPTRKVRHHSIKRDHLPFNGDASSLAMLPAVDSDEEAEIVKLTSNAENSSDPFGREHPFTPMVNREMLCNLVRRAFDQTEEQQAMFEQSLRHEYGRRSKGEILAKELAGQLQVLENNAHPFYKPRLFVTRNGYDLWLQAEKQRVRSLIDKFWHYSLPRPQLWRHYNPTDYHRAYVILLQKIICCESRTERKEPAHAGRTPSAPLSPTARRLLTEFGYRYGVGELYRRIVYLDYLARHFDYEVWYIKHCTQELRGIRELLPRSRHKITAVRKEMEQLRATVHLLHGQTDNSLTRIDRLFLDSDPRKGVASLIELLAEVLDAEQSLFGKKVRPVEEWLKRYLKSGFVLRYERRKEIAHDETVLTTTAQPFVLTPTLVNSLLLDTRDEVIGYKDKFQPVFRPYFDIVPFSKLEFYRLLCADACSLCARKIHTQESRQSISLEMVGLMYRLNERDIEWQGVVAPHLQLWRQHFVNLALIWMDVLGKQINQWVVSAVARDQWSLLAFSAQLSSITENPRFTTAPSGRFTIPSGVPPQVVSSIRPSPFPSPYPNHSGREFRLSPSTITAGVKASGAFTPYRQPVLKRSTPSPLSETSGAVSSDLQFSSSSSADVSGGSGPIVGDFPSLISSQLNSKDTNGQESLLKFSSHRHVGGGGGSSSNDEEYGHPSTVEYPREIQVSASVYSGYEPETEQRPSPELQRSLESVDSSLPSPSLPHPPETQQTTGNVTGSNGNTAFKVPTASGGEITRVVPTSPQVTVTEPHKVESKEKPRFKHQEDPSNNDIPIDVNVQIVQPEEFARQQQHSPDEEDIPKSKHISGHDPHHLEYPGVKYPPSHKIRSAWITRPNQAVVTSSSEFNPSVSIEVMDPAVKPPSLRPSGLTVTNKFGNLLENCNAEGSDVSAPKPRIVQARNHEDLSYSTATAEFHIPPAGVSTVPELADWAKEHPHCSDESSPGSYSGTDSSNGHPTPPQANSKRKGSIEVRSTSDEDSNHAPDSPESLDPAEQLRTFLFPVSNSPVDMVTMLNRLASFTGVLLDVLSPKLKANALQLDRKSGAEEYPSEIANAREHTKQQKRFSESMQKEFLKKLHRIMLSAFKLYADNLLCMDLCCWPGGDASKLLGEQKVQGLKRRKDMGEIWGCRHMVEERHGFHPGGIPCQKKTSSKQFENITRDMCIRINNIHTLITIFQLLEQHLYSTVRKSVRRPVATFGYLSSDTSDALHSNTRGHLNKPNPHRTRPQRDGLTVPNKDNGSWPSSISPTLGPMEPDDDGGATNKQKGTIPDYGFGSKESQRLLEHLEEVQLAQLKMLCIRMNNFFKPALSLLLDLKLGDCAIEKRLSPLITFLDRHRYALQKYIYPDCFSKIMEYLWEYILQDLEEEAIKLRISKKPVTSKAQMLLQSASLMIQFMHNQESGLPLDLLTTSSEYLLGLLDIMTRSTDQLITIFNKLCAPQFTRSNLDLNRAPVAIDSRVLHNLRTQLHTYKKCFSGKEFVDKVLEIGRFYETRTDNPSDSDATPITPRRASSMRVSSARVFSPTGQPIEYTVRYAIELAQFLLKENILIQVLSPTIDSNGVFTPLASTDSEIHRNTTPGAAFSTSYEQGGGSALSASLRSQGMLAPGTPQRSTRSRGTGASSIESAQSDVPYRYDDHRSSHRNLAADFSHAVNVFYKFADSEDADSAALYQSQILIASSIQSHPSGNEEQGGNRLRVLRDERNDFNSAKQGTLFLVYDLLLQRSRKEKRARQFLQSPRALVEAERRRAAGNVNCDLIFKM